MDTGTENTSPLPSFNGLDQEQDRLMAGYREASIFRTNPRAQEYLHLFFSPRRIPSGLTDRQVEICIRLYPYRKHLTQRYDEIADDKLARARPIIDYPPVNPPPSFTDAVAVVEAGVHETIEEATNHLEYLYKMVEHVREHPMRTYNLPPELLGTTEMTPERFKQGIKKFIAEYRKIFGRR